MANSPANGTARSFGCAAQERISTGVGIDPAKRMRLMTTRHGNECSNAQTNAQYHISTAELGPSALLCARANRMARQHRNGTTGGMTPEIKANCKKESSKRVSVSGISAAASCQIRRRTAERKREQPTVKGQKHDSRTITRLSINISGAMPCIHARSAHNGPWRLRRRAESISDAGSLRRAW